MKEVKFCNAENPFDTVQWGEREVSIQGEGGKKVFAQKSVEAPVPWSDLAVKIAASKYLHGDVDKGDDPKVGGREASIRLLIHRVVNTIADWGLTDGYFADQSERDEFYREMAWLCLHQYGAFNSPVWFNVGLHHEYGIGGGEQGNYVSDGAVGARRAGSQYEYPQASACFIQSVTDDLDAIMDLAKSEARLFKYGSGTGSDLSPLRSSREKLSGGGRASGPLSFLRVYDQVANVVKSGGKNRRAAKMNTLKVWHPDIEEFIGAKLEEEKKAWALIEQGYSADFNGGAYASVMFQNENLSVRVSDEFMEAARAGGKFFTRAVTSGAKMEEKDAKALLRKIAEAAHQCGDPGVQYDDTINDWHTCPQTDRQHSTNPCSEFSFINDSACNLASLNLVKFLNADGGFDADRFAAAARLFIIAQDILVDRGSYPTPAIAVNSHLYRPLGIGYANLGALLMRKGLPYDSEHGRTLAAQITALLTGAAYRASAEIAGKLGAFAGLYSGVSHANPDGGGNNHPAMMQVMHKHFQALGSLSRQYLDEGLRLAASRAWLDAIENGEKHGFRNAQVSVLAPTGTIGFLMDCDTTGIEPDMALVKHKHLVGGGSLTLVNNSVRPALEVLGYTPEEIESIKAHVETRGTVEGSAVREGDLAVFDCAFPPAGGARRIQALGHISMMAAVQPFLSGAISKTVNLPGEVSVEDIEEIYVTAWKLGLKAVAVYRDGSKRSAPITVGKKEDKKVPATTETSVPARRRMPETRKSVTHKFSIAGHEGYLTAGLFDNGRPGEVFVRMAKEGSTLAGLMDAFGTAVSLALQYGVPLEDLVRKFSHTSYEPSGWTTNKDVPMAKSITDYIFRWLACEFIDGYRAANSPHRHTAEEGGAVEDRPAPVAAPLPTVRYHDGKSCVECGSVDVAITGTCATCRACGTSLGCS